MKLRVICVLVLLAASGFCFNALGQTKSSVPKFAGTWILNREKSEGLTGGLGNAEILLIVAQDSKQISAEQKTIIRGREQPSRELNYKLDGSETDAEVVRPLAGTMKLKARWIESGKTLELISTVSGENEGKQTTITTKEQWQLIGKGDALKILRTRHSPQGTQIFKLYFEKQ